MRRALILLAVAAVIIAGYGALHSAPPTYEARPEDEAVATSFVVVTLGLAWLALNGVLVVAHTPAAVRDARAWWRRRRAITTYRIGSPPVRPDAVANLAP